MLKNNRTIGCFVHNYSNSKIAIRFSTTGDLYPGVVDVSIVLYTGDLYLGIVGVLCIQALATCI